MANGRGRKLSQGLDVDRLDQLVKDLGVRVRLYKSTPAPNMKSIESYDQDLNDPISNNNMIDFDCEETIALFQQQSMMESFQIQGTYHIDEILVTFLSGVTLAPFAKIELLDFEEDFYELVPRQVGSDVDFLKYKACRVLGIFTYDRSSKTTDRYYQGTDFELTEEGDIQWISTHRPADKQVYTIYYKYRPIYRALKAVHRDRFSQYNLRVQNIKAPKTTVDGNTYVKLPETWVIKRDFLLERKKNTNYDPNEA